MSESTTDTVYSVDTSSMMDWQARYYPATVFLGLIQQMETLVGVGRIVAPAIVHDEIKAVGTTELITWAKAQAGLFVPMETVFSETQTIQSQYPGLRDPKAEYEEADAYVIALAKIRGGFVVTEETPALAKKNPKRKYYIPDVCKGLGIPCISLLGLMHREQWTF